MNRILPLRKGLAAAAFFMALAILAGGQTGSSSAGTAEYQSGLSAAQQGAWPLARQAFLTAAREGKKEALDGSWTPGFAAAYSGYRWALEIPGATERGRVLEAVVQEASGLLDQGFHSPEAYFVLSQSLTLLRRDDLYAAMTQKWKRQGRFSASVDGRVVTEEDKQVVTGLRSDLLALIPVAAPQPTGPAVRPDPRPRQEPALPQAGPAVRPGTWESQYQEALEKALAGDWPRARQSFQNAARQRKGDIQDPTRVSGGREPRVWRSGAPYSPVFGSAYSAYRWALEVAEDAERARLLGQAAEEAEALIKAGQHSPEAYFVASQALVLLREEKRFDALNETWKKQRTFNFRVDPEILTSEDKEVVEIQKGEQLAVAATASQAKPNEPKPTEPKPTEPKPTEPKPDEVKPAEVKPVEPKPAEQKPSEQKPPRDTRTGGRRAPGAADPGTGTRAPRQDSPAAQPAAAGQGGPLPVITDMKATDLGATAPAPTGDVPYVPTKFALLIGNGESAIAEGGISFASNSIAAVQEGLTKHAGYSPENVTVLANATAEQMRTAVASLAGKLPEGATVFVYFTGSAFNVSGVDYLAGVDALDAFQTANMVRKDEVFRAFTAKNARVFSFFESARPNLNGRVFGSQAPSQGSISQMMGTLEGKGLASVFQDGKEVGVFALGIKRVLTQFRSSSVPLTEFAWQVFYAMRGGKDALGSVQTPTLPVVVLLEQDARF